MLDRPRSAYIHVPFCRHRCGYCNFSVIADRDDLIDPYLAAIDAELKRIAEGAGEPPELDTVFVGGGTPTHLPVQSLDRFLRMIRRRFQLHAVTEWTMEANPEDITDEKLRLMRQHGVNRISLGIQSFNDAKLATLERSHSGTLAASVVRQVAETIENVSIDLIFSAPGESVSDWENDLDVALSLPVRHVSTYALTFEKGTSFWTRRRRGDLSPIDESSELDMYDLARAKLSSAGLMHYEISNFAAQGFQCRHNLAYWRGAGWYAAGPGAAAFVANRRTVNHRSPTTYLKRIRSGQSPIAESETISTEQRARESAAFGVRLIEGLDLNTIRRHTDFDIEAHCGNELARLESQGLISRDGDRVKLTERGIHFADTVASEFLG